MNTLNRLVLFVIAAAFLSLTFGAVSAQEPVTLNLWTFLTEDGVLQAVVEAFQAEYPHITVQITDVPEAEYVTKVDTAILAGAPPDLGFPYTQKWIKAGHLLPINDTMAAQGINVDDLNYGAITRNCLFEDQIYCLGSYTGGTLMFYNKDMFDAAGIPYPSPTEPMTIDQYAEYAMKLSVPSDNPEERVWGGALPEPWWMDVRNYYSDDGRTAEVNDAATVHFYQVVADLYNSGSVLTSADTSMMTVNSNLDLVATGQLAMAVGDSVVGQPLLEGTDIRWGATVPPVEQAGDPGWAYTGSDELAAFSASAHPEEAKLFVTYWGSEGNRIRFEMTGDLPLNMQMAEELNWAGESEGRQEMLAAIQSARPSLFVPEWFFVFDLLSEAMVLMTEDGLSAQEALDEMAPIVQDQLDENWETWDQIQPAQ